MSDDEDDELLETTVLCALTAGRVSTSRLGLVVAEIDSSDRAGQPQHHLHRG